MENQSKEKKRAANIVWNAAEDYSFQPDFEVYDAAGHAELYWNYVFGAVRRYYDYPRLHRFIDDLKADPDHDFYESLLWIGLENCVYEKGKSDRPVLQELRRRCAEKTLRQESLSSFYYLVDEIKTAHFQRVLGQQPVLREQVCAVLDELEFPASIDTEQIISRMGKIIDAHFPLKHPLRHRRRFKSLFPHSRKINLGEGHSSPFRAPFTDTPIVSLFSVEAADFPEEIVPLDPQAPAKRKSRFWHELKEGWEKRQRKNIQNYYGVPMYSESQTIALERALCTKNHKGCHLHFTRGEFDAHSLAKAGPVDPRRAAFSQRERNKVHYKDNIARYSISIEKITHMLRTTLLANLENSQRRAKAGSLVAGKVWRNVYLYDDQVFSKSAADEIGNLTIDILLDASGSQMDRQEIIAAQAFIVAESLTRCQIPVRVYSFCTNRNFTVLSLFRDYGEVNKNEMIFHYHTSGCNRDGLAVRTALHLMKDSPAEHKILLILTDAKPLDPQGISGGGFSPDLYIYADDTGVRDTAMEVRKGWQEGVSVLGIFTGAQDDIPAAQKIYGQNLVCINGTDQFADRMGILLRNVLKNL